MPAIPYTRPCMGGRLLQGLVVALSAVLLTGATTLKFRTSAGTLEVEVDDPAVKVWLDGQELTITGAGPQDVRLKTGPHLFHAEQGGSAIREDVLTLRRDERVVVRVRTTGNIPAKPVRSRDELVQEYRRAAEKIFAPRADLDARVWEVVKARWIHQEAAKLLLQFHRGDGRVADTPVPADVAAQLRADLANLREMRARAYAPLAEAARLDATMPGAPGLIGAWDVTEMQGGSGQAAATLELFEPDPIGRKLALADGLAALYNASNLLIFDVRFPADTPGAVDFVQSIRGNTVYRGRYCVGGDEATLRLNPINAARPDAPAGEPTAGGLVLRLKRSAPTPVAAPVSVAAPPATSDGPR